MEEIPAAVRLLPAETRGLLIPLLWDEVAPEDRAAPSPALIPEAKRRGSLLDTGRMETEDRESVRIRAQRTADLSE